MASRVDPAKHLSPSECDAARTEVAFLRRLLDEDARTMRSLYRTLSLHNELGLDGNLGVDTELIHWAIAALNEIIDTVGMRMVQLQAALFEDDP